MKKNWIGTIVLVGVSLAAGLVFSQMWEQVLGQAGSFSADAPQVVVNQQAELPKCVVDFTTLPLQGGAPSQIRVVTVVDTEAKRIAVYHLDMSTGRLQLLSVRDIQPDLTLHQFNAMLPLPTDIAREVQQLRTTNR
jgi:hypothetical protein